ncbi:glycoside hydrolase family 3 C-terminal domain-containing protein [Schaalia sp. 19OD2882]|uniref:glycoside hydrolase family 3 N-terminal domain-containing protein n=1 Tax=Schaalia sp. 19OD2882 TaxID=2794089 RepID=UPI001C1EB510|nr:glycoside hydrolase family 3 N-terminal domain-containing protein [Schaalia sp. 19OD2882]QWW20415.1 glycoside hydrolase family 3 C-terminal domain-containing protein [Schaalia sp. 19OD2882]
MVGKAETTWRRVRRALRRLFVYGACSVLVLAGLAGTFVLGPRYEGILSIFLGAGGTELVNPGGAETQRFTSAYASADERRSALEALSTDVSREGITLMRNSEGALPLKAGAKVTVLGQDGVDPVHGGGGAGSVDASTAVGLVDGLAASGLQVNPTLTAFYKEGPGKEFRKTTTDVYGRGDFAVNEVPQSAYTEDALSSFDSYGDAALVVIGRSGGESSDLPTAPDAKGRTYLQLSTEELDLLTLARERFPKVIVLLNTQNAMDLSELDQIRPDALVWIGALGQGGAKAVGEVLTGAANPSGALVDTYSTDSLSAPATANIGDFSISNSQVPNGDKVIAYSEGIYVGYRYYETRYEDVVRGQGNAGRWTYADEVQFPFGHGLSYTDFQWSTASTTRSAKGWMTTVTVTNTGSVAGKDVVQLYLHAPYSDQDRSAGIERAAVNLVGFAKTRQLAPGESQTVTIETPEEALRVWDPTVGTWIVEAGQYALALGQDAHQALNSVLAATGIPAERLDGPGVVDLVHRFTVATTDRTTWATAPATGRPVTARFEEADPAHYGQDWTRLSRSDWQGTWPTTFADGSWEAPARLLEDLAIDTVSSGGDGASSSGASTPLKAVDLVGKDWDDPAWETLVGQLGVDELDALVRVGGYQTRPVESIQLPGTVAKDGSAGISNTLVGGTSGTAYPPEVVLASSWNTQLATEFGAGVGEDSLALGVTGWYAPSTNIHRSPYSGRNFEYWSEDPLLSGDMTAVVVSGARSKGVIAWTKHFALNDQETNRMGVVTFADEQTIREIYLSPFETAVRRGGANAVMVSMNRIGARWAGGHRGLMTEVLRGEWGFRGAAITDQASFANFAYEDLREGLAAGTSLWLNTDSHLWKLDDEALSEAVVADMRRAAKDVVFTVVNSNAMNGVGPETTVRQTVAPWKVMMWGFTAFAVALTALCTWLDVRGARTRRRARQKALAEVEAPQGQDRPDK